MSLPTYQVQSEFQGGYTKRRKTTTRIVVHHAAALYRQATGIEDVRAVAAYHTKTRGWPGIGYSICLAEETNGGRIARYNVSDLDLERAHVAWWNDRAVGVSCLTNFTGLPEQKWIDALAEVLAELQQRYPAAIIVGHKEIALGPSQSPDGKDWRTACPGPLWSTWKPQLLARVNELLAPHPDPLRAKELPGIGKAIYCSEKTEAFYTLHGGLSFFGYPVSDERVTEGADEQPCTILPCERAVIKTKLTEPAHQALLKEVFSKGWA